jgi:hypothetical protein
LPDSGVRTVAQERGRFTREHEIDVLLNAADFIRRGMFWQLVPGLTPIEPVTFPPELCHVLPP